MRVSPGSPGFGYIVAILATGMVALARLGLWDVLADRGVYLSFVASVTLAAWSGGLRAALLATTLGMLAALYLLGSAPGGFTLARSAEAMNAVVFLAVGILIGHLGQGYRRLGARQQQSERELELERDAREQLRLAQEAGRMGSWEWDLRSNLLSWSPSLAALHGLPLTELPKTLSAYQQLVHPDDRNRVLEAFEAVLRHGREYAVEYRILVPGGEERWLEGRGRLFRDRAHAPARLIATCIDITNRKRAEEAFARSEQRFGRFMQHLPGLAWIKDLAGRYIYANQAALEAFGKTFEQLRGKVDEEIFLPEQAAMFRENDQRALETPNGIRTLETLTHQQGELHYSVVSKFPVPGGGGAPALVGGIAIDITDHKRAEAELQKQNLRLMLLGEAASVLLTSDTTAELLHRLFGTISSHLGLDAYLHYVVTESGDGLELVSWRGFPEPEAKRAARLRFGEAISGTVALERRPIETGDVQLSRLARDAKVKSLGIEAYVCYPLVSEGRLIGTLAFGSRSRRRFAPDDLAFLRTVSRYVTVATERLRLIEQLREADRRKDEFLATLAHELRNPLAPIRHALEIQRRAEHDRATIERTREMMDRQLTQLVRLIDDLLDVSRITQGRLELRLGAVELGPVLQHAVEDNRPLIEAGQLQVHWELPPAPVYLRADAARLAQVFFNLLNNAAKYTQRGGQVWLRTRIEPDTVVVTVRDSGVGIPPGMLGRVFDLFVRVEPSPQGMGEGGLGIGLTLVRHLVELHGGTVEARSAGPGAGSEFEVRLPAAAVLPEPAAPAAASIAGAVKRRILVADDNRESAESLKLMLELMGSEVHTAHDGQQCLILAEALHPEVAILDIGMPRYSGYDVARRIRGQPWGRKVLLIALTGWGQETDRLRSEAAGFDHHLVKPVEPTQLEKLLQTD